MKKQSNHQLKPSALISATQDSESSVMLRAMRNGRLAGNNWDRTQCVLAPLMSQKERLSS